MCAKTYLLERDSSKYGIEGKLGELLQDGDVLKTMNMLLKNLVFLCYEIRVKRSQEISLTETMHQLEWKCECINMSCIYNSFGLQLLNV